MSEISKEEMDELPTSRFIAVRSEHILQIVSDNLLAIMAVRKDLEKSLSPIQKSLVRGTQQAIQDRENLETELLEQMKGAEALSAKLIEAEAHVRTEQAAVSDRDKIIENLNNEIAALKRARKRRAP